MLSRIKELRTEQNLSLRELASKLGISYTSLGKYERNEQQPSFETLEKIADYFQVSIDYLLGRSDNRTYDNLVFDTDMKHLKKAFNNAPALVKSHFTNIIDSVFVLSFGTLKDGSDIEYIKLIEQIFDCLLKIHQTGLNNFILPPTSKEIDTKYQLFLSKQEELNNLIKQLFYYSNWNDFSQKDQLNCFCQNPFIANIWDKYKSAAGNYTT